MKRALLLTSILAMNSSAMDQRATIVDIQTGRRSEPVVITNGAVFRIADGHFRVEIDQSEDEVWMANLRKERISLSVDKIPADSFFRMMQNAIKVTVAVDKSVTPNDLVTVYSDGNPALQVIETACRQIGATMTVTNKMIRIAKSSVPAK